MTFHDWLNEKFIEWRGNTRKTVSEFSIYLGVSQPTVSAWMNKTRGQPTSTRIISALADKLGPDVYEVLGMPHPILAEEEKDPSFREWMQIFRNANDEKRQELLKKVRPDAKVSHEARP